MKLIARYAALAVIAGAIAAGLWLASKGSAPDRRDLDAVVTLGGDAVHDAIHPLLDLTRMSDGEEAALGAAIDREIRAHVPVGGDARTEAYLSRVLRPIAANVTRTGIPYTIALVRSPEVNAFAVAGGRLYVNEGMLAFASSEAELAAVIGHEISHVDLRHCASRLQIERTARKVSPVAAELAKIGYEIALLGFSEEQELAADRNGAILAARASYDPWAAADLFRKFLRREETGDRKPTRNPVVEIAEALPGALNRYLATHPPADERVEAVRRALDAQPALWRGERRYTGRSNLANRIAMADDPREDEWSARAEAPSVP